MNPPWVAASAKSVYFTHSLKYWQRCLPIDNCWEDWTAMAKNNTLAKWPRVVWWTVPDPKYQFSSKFSRNLQWHACSYVANRKKCTRLFSVVGLPNCSVCNMQFLPLRMKIPQGLPKYDGAGAVGHSLNVFFFLRCPFHVQSWHIPLSHLAFGRVAQSPTSRQDLLDTPWNLAG